MKPDVLVIGAGPGGYVAAIRLGQLGKSVLVVDKGRIGGVCLNWGCIPTKSLLHATHVVKLARDAGKMGIILSKPEVDIAKLNEWKSGVVDRLVKGIESLFKANNVEHMQAEAQFVGPGKVMLKKANGTSENIEPGSVIIATGSEAFSLPGLELDGERVFSSNEAVELKRIPDRLLVVGAGAVGLEFAAIYAGLGSKVTVVEIMEQVLPGMDKELAATLQRTLKRQGIDIMLESTVKDLEKGDTLKASISQGDKAKVMEFDAILVSVGRRPSTHGLNLDAAGTAVDEKGYIKVDEKRRTSVSGVYAIGDVAGPPLLAHKASKEGLVAAEVIAGNPAVYDPAAMPSCVFTFPEFATVGLSEEEATSRGRKISVGKFPLLASGRALTMGETQGLVKIVADAETDAVLGVHILGPEASTLIGEAVLAIEMGATAEDIALSIHPHPTVSETLMEAAENVHKRAIHTLNR
jgi:dihydrolipoamide dehydrogenase